MNAKLGWGILGTARINEKILPRFAASPRNRLVALASRDLSKARTAAAPYAIPNAYGSYAECLADPAVDAVYVGLPNHLHFEWTRAALAAGKHVLCEKPLALKGDEAEELVRLAAASGKKLAEGYMYRHHAQSARVLSLVREGALGEIRRVQGSFHITVAPGPNIRTDGRFGGGAIGDVGCYLVNFANAIVGRGPTGVHARGRVAGKTPETDYDTLFSAILDYGDGVTAQLDGGFLGPRIDELRILGSEGWLEIPHPFKPSAREALVLKRRPTRDAPLTAETIEIADAEDPYGVQLENFAAWVRGETPTYAIAEWEAAAGAATLERMAAEVRN